MNQGLLSDIGDMLPAWLPDDPNKKEAMRAGLLNFGAALMGGRGNLGQILGSGLMAGSQGYAGAQAAQQAAALQSAQVNRYGLESQKIKAELDAPMRLARIARGEEDGSSISGLPQLGATPAVTTLPQLGVPRAPSAAMALAGGAPMPMAKPDSQPQFQVAAPALDGAIDGATEPTQIAAADPVPSAAPPMGAPAADPMQQMQPVVPQLPPVTPSTSVVKAPWMAKYDSLMKMSERMGNAGEGTLSKQYFDMATKLRPEIHDQKPLQGPNGELLNIITYKDGTQSVSQYGVAPDNQVVDVGGKQIVIDKLRAKDGQSFAKTATPGEIINANEQRAGRAQSERHWKAEQDNGGEVPITGDAITNAAARYNLDGTLPPMGMGKAAAAGRSAILNKAAELASGVDPTEQRKNQLGNKNEIASQGASVREFARGKLGNSVRSFNVSLSHLETLGNLADALHNGDAKMINKVGNYFAEQAGGAAPTNFDAAKKIVGDEIVKAIVGSGGGVHDREEAARVIAASNSPAQLKGSIETYKELMRGQLTGLRQQYETSTGKNDFDKFLSPHAKEAVKPVSALPQKAAAPVTIAGAADYAKVPSGALYVAPDGHTRRKP